jgi:hypothetical protein
VNLWKDETRCQKGKTKGDGLYVIGEVIRPFADGGEDENDDGHQSQNSAKRHRESAQDEASVLAAE